MHQIYYFLKIHFWLQKSRFSSRKYCENYLRQHKKKLLLFKISNNKKVVLNDIWRFENISVYMNEKTDIREEK
jgi:hypothetical protein